MGGGARKKGAILNAPKSCFDLVYSVLLHLLGAPVRAARPYAREGVNTEPTYSVEAGPAWSFEAYLYFTYIF